MRTGYDPNCGARPLKRAIQKDYAGARGELTFTVEAWAGGAS